MVVGAFLTQNTAWTNVEKAIANLRRARVLHVKGIREIPLPKLEQLIRSSGYFRQKARKLKNFIEFLDSKYSGSLDRMFAQPTANLRSELLALNGVGLETADSILLYAGNHPVFVVDAYARRILERHGILGPKAGYEEIRSLIETAISSQKSESFKVIRTAIDPGHPVSRISAGSRGQLAQHFNEFHAVIVRAGKQYCRSTAQCEGCPLQKFLSSDHRIA
ncbi:MAG TPA: endonuclease III domain-containing protein [Candidatus Angelobacter sp.]|nr:endonuclease III domain-containing protein [Candidatus Angelobacter sp.]